jgi:sulfite reductase beta subunit-like hemoprotein
MPRKPKVAISGLQDVVHEVNDVSFVAVDHPAEIKKNLVPLTPSIRDD